LNKELKKLGRYAENLKEARLGFNEAKTHLKLVKVSKKKLNFTNGSIGIADGAVKSGIDIYYAYPMTPATPVLGELAQRQKKDKFVVSNFDGGWFCLH